MGPEGKHNGRAVDRLVTSLADVVGPTHVLTDPELTASYETDWTGRFAGRAAAVVRPGTTDEVAAVMALLHGAGRPVVPQGGNTGLVGGGVPLHGEVVVSLRRLAAIDDVDVVAGQVTVGAGATLAAVDAAAGGAGLAFGVDLAARDSATVGGMVATNAGGLRMLRYGGMRAQTAGVEAVLADGRVLSHLGGLAKDNTGYDLAGLLAGSEGTLAVVTRLRLRLVPRLEYRTTGLLAFGDADAALEALVTLRRRLPGSLEAVELFLADGVALVCDHLGLAAAVRSARPCLPPRRGGRRPRPDRRAGRSRRRRCRRPGPRRRGRVGAGRPGPAVALPGGPHRGDQRRRCAGQARRDPALRPSWPDSSAAVCAAVDGAAPGARCVLFGHAGDGNVHVNVLGAETADRAAAVEDAVLRLVARLGGSISAEHGIGTAKRPWLHLNRSPAEIDAFRAIKRALDPAGILNPHVLLPEPDSNDETVG